MCAPRRWRMRWRRRGGGRVRQQLRRPDVSEAAIAIIGIKHPAGHARPQQGITFSATHVGDLRQKETALIKATALQATSRITSNRSFQIVPWSLNSLLDAPHGRPRGAPLNSSRCQARSWRSMRLARERHAGMALRVQAHPKRERRARGPS